MNWNYENYIITELLSLQTEMGLSDFKFEVETEQSFVKRKDYDENTIYIIIKYLTDDKTIGAVNQPVQFLILTEQNSLDVAKALFDKFAADHNLVPVSYTYTKNSTSYTEYIKQQYTAPVVLSNFNPVLYGYRSVMYMTSSLFIMDNLVDFRKITIDGDEIEPLNFAISYSMTPNTQQLTSEHISSSVKSTSSLSITLTIPMKGEGFVEDILAILNEESNGNNSFGVSLYTDAESNTPVITTTMKLISAQITTAVDQIPSIQVGLMK